VRADALLQCLRSECAKRPDYISHSTPLVTNVFRIFLRDGNQSLTPVELHQQIPWASAESLLRTLTSGTVYMGIRPAQLD